MQEMTGTWESFIEKARFSDSEQTGNLIVAIISSSESISKMYLKNVHFLDDRL